MAKQIMQFRYYSEDNDRNYPKRKSYGSNLVTGAIFNGLFPITQLGIQTLPGTKFYLNDGRTPIIIGSTGIYELDLEGLSEITRLTFDKGSIDRIANNASAYLIIDLIYDNKGGN